MTTRSGARVYRRAPRPQQPGVCGGCGRPVKVNVDGRLREHRDQHGHVCSGSHAQVADRDRSSRYDIDAALAALPPTQPVRLDDLDPHTNSADRRKKPGRCADCGQNPRHNGDGTLEAHRHPPIVGPYCPGGQPRGRS